MLNNKQFHRLFGLIIFSAISVLLSSCSHTGKHDGPPNFYVDETKIPNAIPKAEPLAKYGNYKSYVVFGKRYHTLNSSNHYNEIGTASWYGMKFHARKTSSGERYNALGMTAAHKTLPLPTYVEVTNLKNHKKIIVKVNDRGPFAPHRIIDLSYVAAKKLGMLGHGTAKVRVTAINPRLTPSDTRLFADSRPIIKHQPLVNSSHLSQPSSISYSNPELTKHSSSVYLQVGAFRNKDRAKKLQNRLTNLFSMPVSIFTSANHQQLYRVKMGPFNDMTVADQMTHRLKKLGIPYDKIKN